MNDKETIRNKLLDILKNKYNIKETDNIDSLNLLGKTIKMGASDLMCLFLDVEKEFNIVISQEDVIAGRFKTINKIIELIYEKTA